MMLILSLTLMLLCCSSLLSASGSAAAADRTTGSTADALKTPPALTADTHLNVVNKPVELIFGDDSNWRDAICSICVNGAALDSGQYSIGTGKITIDKSLFRISRDYTITVIADGYEDAAVNQTIGLLCITGDGIRQETVLTREQLEAMPQVRKVFSATNDFPMDLPVAVEGVPLQALLDSAGIKEEAQLLSFIGTDGYWTDFTREELLQQKRYIFPDRTEIEPVVALQRAERSDDFADMDTAYTPVLCVGQRAATEQTLLTFVKSLQTIRVKTEPLQRWEPPAAKIIDPDSRQRKPISGGEVSKGAQIVLTGDPKTKIYYTTDGSEPDLDSKIYNLHGCGPMAGQDEPIMMTADTTIKAKGVWPGKLDSETAVFIFTAADQPDAAIPDVVQDGDRAPELGPVFSDIQNSWAREDIEFLAGRGLVTGKSSCCYEPDSKITRAEFSVLLVRALGLPEKVLAEGQFTADWYAGSIAAAAAQNIICGDEEQFFKPDHNITREEMAVMMVRAGRIAGKVTELSAAEQEEMLVQFQDKDKISSWAWQAAAMAVKAGIIRGTADGKFAPQAELDRAQTAAVIKRFLNYSGLMAESETAQ